ncbi:MAG TPA: uroporphyrinogen decarboxylase family protein [Candidatus Atribacteria bacterium]|nr:uroporphyrinogen decarboxylase family protein [Candidatus Atribacteria bacterium]
MTKRQVIKTVLDHEKPPYVPWSFGFTKEAADKLIAYYNSNSHCSIGSKDELEDFVGNHLLKLGSDIGFFEDVGLNLVRDVFGVVWDRSIDKDIGNVQKPVLSKPSLQGYKFPNPLDQRFFQDIPEKIQRYPDRFRVFQIGFSLYERAWTLRGMEQLMMDFYDYPDFVHELLHTIADYNITQVKEAMKYDIDAVYFGDDWGQQRGLQMGPKLWKEFIYPELRRMYGSVKQEGKYVFIHSCGDVDELFDDLIEIGVDCFNPFQPEVMDIFQLIEKYRSRLSFHGGLSTQQTLPYGTPQDVVRETRRLIDMGRSGGYILAPAHDVEGDVPLPNMLAFIEETQKQI